jgi:glycosyltransferase involved in cell wall biosynthesis
MTPLVSVVIAAYNHGRFLREAIDSALRQTVANLEVIVVDDGSTDETASLMQSYSKQPRLAYQRREHSGVAAAKSAGVQLARAPFIAFLDADDQWLPHKLERQLPLFDADAGVGVVYARRLLMNEDGEPIAYCQPTLYRGNVLDRIFQKNFICFSSAVVRRQLLDQVGLFDPALPFGVDYDLWLRLAQSCRFDFVDEALVKYRTGHASLSRLDTERTLAALGIMERFLNNHGGRELLDPAAVRRGFAITYCHLALAFQDQSSGTAWRWALKSVASAPTYGLGWKVLASLAFPAALRGWWRRRTGKWKVRRS